MKIEKHLFQGGPNTAVLPCATGAFTWGRFKSGCSLV